MTAPKGRPRFDVDTLDFPTYRKLRDAECAYAQADVTTGLVRQLVRSLVEDDGVPIAAIARELDVDRSTVRRWVRDGSQ